MMITATSAYCVTICLCVNVGHALRLAGRPLEIPDLPRPNIIKHMLSTIPYDYYYCIHSHMTAYHNRLLQLRLPPATALILRRLLLQLSLLQLLLLRITTTTATSTSANRWHRIAQLLQEPPQLDLLLHYYCCNFYKCPYRMHLFTIIADAATTTDAKRC